MQQATAIDLFAGMGGTTTGAEMTGRVKVVWAANHWGKAVKLHEKNHPSTDCKCQDLHQADWAQVPSHDIGLASPCCHGHSHAKGKERPEHDISRSTAWAVVSCAEYHQQEVFIVENVTAFLKWTLYPSWADAMQRLGYTLSPHIINAADHGVPQDRVRLFIVCTRSQHPIKLNINKQEHMPVNSVINWDGHPWKPIRTSRRSKNTIARIIRGRRDLQQGRFVIPYYGSGSGLTGRSIHRPIGTVTTRDRWALVKGNKMRMLQKDEYAKIMGFPENTILPEGRTDAIHMLGNAVCPPVMRDILNEVLRVA